jgi:hypothetical protein
MQKMLGLSFLGRKLIFSILGCEKRKRFIHPFGKLKLWSHYLQDYEESQDQSHEGPPDD